MKLNYFTTFKKDKNNANFINSDDLALFDLYIAEKALIIIQVLRCIKIQG